MSLKVHFPNVHLVYFSENLGGVRSKEIGFIKTLRRWKHDTREDGMST
jgi:hypothetical protein